MIGRNYKVYALTLDSKRQILAKQILKLREVKFPKALFNLLKSTKEKFTSNELYDIMII